MAIAIGADAPDFTLTRRVMEAPVRLSDFHGERAVLILFFPLAFSSVCTDEMCRVVEDYSRWTDLGAEVLGISVDSPFVNTRFAQEIKAPFPILSDFNREVATAYGVRNDDYFGMKGVADRSAFVVDRNGRIAYAWTTADDSILPPFEEVEEAVRAAD